ncbi:MAG: alpha/beta fold hydrolase [Acidimicrobiales bacterium]
MSRPQLLWAHGLLSSVADERRQGLFDWAEITDSVRVICYDTRGHGQADAPHEERAYRWSAMVDDMLWASGGGPFVAGGIGMGAAVALYAALAAPRRVQGLVLALPPPAWEERAGEAKRLGEMATEVSQRAAALLGSGDSHRPNGQQPSPAGSRTEPVQNSAEPGGRTADGSGAPAAARIALDPYADLVNASRPGSDPRVLAAVLKGATASDLPPRTQIASLVMPALVLACPGPRHPVAVARTLADTLILAEHDEVETLASAGHWVSLIGQMVADLPQWES